MAEAALSLDAAVAQITATDPRFRVTEAVIRGQRQRVFETAPPHMRALFEDAAAAYGDGDALVYAQERWSYAQLRRDVARLSHAMRRELGLRRGDRVGLALRNYPEMVILFLAAAASGLVAVPLNAWWSGEELSQAIRDGDIAVVFADGPRAARLRAQPELAHLRLIGVREAETETDTGYTALRDRADDSWPDVAIEPEDDLAIMFSSGSTGAPKGVLQTHRNAISAVWSWMMGREMAPLLAGTPAAAPKYPPAWLVPSPLFHVTALYANLIQGLACGAKLALMYKWDTDEAIRLIRDEQITRVSGVPTQTADLAAAVAAQGLSFDHLEAVGGGGSSRPAAQVRQLHEVFPNAVPGIGWGMSETCALGIILSGPEYLANPEAAGRLTPPLQQMKIVDAEGRELPEGEVGELLVRGPSVMRGYLNQPEETARTLRDGWLHTGDLVRIGAGGLIHIVDRKKCIVIRAGENVSCLEVENALHDHPDIAEACVFPVPHPRLGETVGAAIYAPGRPQLDDLAVTGFLQDRLAHFKLPERLWFRSAPLPRGATDKIDRTAIRHDCLAQGARPDTKGELAHGL